MRRVWLVLLAVLLVPAAARGAVTQPPPPFDPSPLDGDTYYLVNQASGQQADAGGRHDVPRGAASPTSASAGR